ncbi:hypothetical protein QVD17_07643 [Tagetes erecta]|uniref:Uncharacterized protein n=1 Tax=Tagetes erecta TaxID=13708 RepID=A0AAD8LMT1_TARER|nr:hypothetical protein QVD17_07643 [Tagetes erecta]
MSRLVPLSSISTSFHYFFQQRRQICVSIIVGDELDHVDDEDDELDLPKMRSCYGPVDDEDDELDLPPSKQPSPLLLSSPSPHVSESLFNVAGNVAAATSSPQLFFFGSFLVFI